MAWYDSWQYAHRLLITVPSTSTDTLSYFPVPVTEASLPSGLTDNTYGRSDGGDLTFASDLGIGDSWSSVGTRLPCEIVSCTFGGTPSAEIHVQVPSIAATGTPTYMWVLYGNTSQTAQPAANSTYGSQAVWNENGTQNFQAVWHFKEAGVTNLSDSTALGYTTSSYSNATAGTGILGGGGIFSVGSTTAYETTLDPSFSSATITWWQKCTEAYDTSSVMAPLGTWTAYQFNVAFGSGSWAVGWMHTTDTRVVVATTAGNAPQNTWTNYAIQWSSAGTIFSMNGGTVIGSNGTAASVFAGDTLMIGSYGGLQFFNGTMDEVRVSQVVRSASWIASEYASQSAPGTFTQPSGTQLTFGETPPSATNSASLLMGL